MFGTERYRLQNQIWSGQWSGPNWFCKLGHYELRQSGDKWPKFKEIGIKKNQIGESGGERKKNPKRKPCRQWVPSERNSSYNFIPNFLKLCTCFLHGLEICMWFGYNP